MHFRGNFRKNTIFFPILLIIYLIHLPKFSFENNIGSPYIQRIILGNYGFNNDNSSIIQDKKGILYIGNTNGILQYDGSFWNIIKVKGIPNITLHNDGKLYVGAYNQFGFIDSRFNINQFVSLLDSADLQNFQFGQVTKILSYNNSIYFSTRKKIFHWNGKNLSQIDENNGGVELFNVNSKIYLVKSGIGIFKLIDKKFVILPKASFFNKKEIVGILPYNEQMLIKTLKDKEFFIYDNYSIEHFKTQADNFISRHIYSHACELNDGSYAIGTELGGVIVINKKGEIITKIDETSGLLNLSSNYLYADNSNNLWVLHKQGISRIEIPSPYKYYSKNHGLHGNVSSVIRFNNKLYVATSLGVFYLTDINPGYLNESSIVFKPVDNINSVCYEFHIFDDRLFVSCSKGIFEIINDKALIFYNREAGAITSVLHSRKNPNYIYLGQKNGINAIRYVEGILIVEKKITGIDNKITSIAEDNDGTLWLSSDYTGVYKIEPFEKYSKDLEFICFDQNNNLPKSLEWINLYSINNGILFSTSKGVYRFNEETGSFYMDTLLGIDFTNQTNWVYPIVEDSKNNLYLNIIGRNNSKNITLIRSYNQDSLKVLRPLPLNRVKDFFITSIHPDNNGIVWFGGFDGLIKYNIYQESSTHNDFSPIINQITIGKDSIIYQLPFGSISHDIVYDKPISYNLNTVLFKFSATSFESEDQRLFQYKMDGFDTTWSNWTNSNFKEYTNLFEGDYTFRLLAKDIYDNISEVTTCQFSIKPPFFRTIPAYLIYVISAILFFVLLGKWRAYYFARERFRLENIIHERTEEVVIQKEKADNLLERVLPKTTAKELKSGRKAGPYHYNMVTVLFSDIQGFTKISEQLDSELLIDELDKFFLKFDTVAEKYNIEKIKTIGDAYMCAGGIPIKNRTNPVEVVLAAIEMQNFMKEHKSEVKDDLKHIWDLRIGIDTGPVVAGVLGRSKITYDIWGGTVNTASRMEASGEIGKINITENTYMLIKEFFICQYRGKMPVKYKGEIDMYFVDSFKPHLSSDLKGQIPNENFFTQLQMLRINDVEEFVLSKLEDGLPSNLYYHDVKHTIDVVTQVELIGRAEGVSEEDMLLLKTAALFHDMGHLVNYDTHEEESVKLAKKILPQYKYKEEQIDTICKLILITHMPPEPTNLLEEIMCDADLDYLGRTDFVPVSINLYKELAERKKIDSIDEWNEMQIKFIKNHSYFTKTAQKLREVNKKIQLENIQGEIRREIERTDE